MKFQLLLILTLLFAFSFQANAITTVAVDSDGTTLSVTGEKQNVFTKVGSWFKKQQNKATAFIVKKAMAIDWENPGTMIKLCIVAFLGAIVLSVLSVFTFSALSYVAYLLYLASVILFWYWVYLKFIK